jgi:glycosyltransferase involved in cell wall biosynthesis
VITHVGVAVPAHNEEDLLPGCLAAVQRAIGQVPDIGVQLIVVADACTDRTARLARRAGVSVLELQARNVGAARDAGVREIIRRAHPAPPGAIWLTTTDADTLVPADWLAWQIRRARQGYDAILGTVAVTDWAEHPAPVPGVFAARYRHDTGSHSHVHGANLGVNAAAYLAVGGFPPLPTGEDHALVGRLAAGGRSILRTGEISVVTSARRHARAPGGFAHLLTTLA